MGDDDLVSFFDQIDDSLGSLLHGDHLLREIAAQSVAAQRDHNTLTHEKHLNLFRFYTFWSKNGNRCPVLWGVPLRRLPWLPAKMREPVRTDTGRLTYADGSPKWKENIRRKAYGVQTVLRRLTSGTNGRSRAPPEPSEWPGDLSP